MDRKEIKIRLRRGPVLLLIALLLIIGGKTVGEAAAARWPEAPGGALQYSGSLVVDLAGASEGYFQAAVQGGGSSRHKMRVTKDGQKLTYDMKLDGTYEVFPLQLGSGYYDISLYRNVSGKQYAAAGSVGVSVSLSDSEVCFLYPNQYVNYSEESPSVLKAVEICATVEGKPAYDTVCSWMGKNFVYDFVKAITVKAGTLPDIETCFEKKMGVCQDLSAITCSMLRTQGIPARLVIGYADGNYHAWVTAVIDGKELFFDPIVAVSGMGKVKSYTVERWY